MGRFIRDNIEAFAVAIAMALVIRHYCIEAFRIPTHSMRPTLSGDHAGPSGYRRHGDRILVDKFVYQRREPRRWEVIVFRYPVNENINFIKRLIGLPGDRLRVADGDIWTSPDQGKTWAIARKPAGARDQMLNRYYPPPFEAPGNFVDTTVWQAGEEWSIDEERRRFTVDTPGPSELFFRPKVMPYPSWPNLSSTTHEVGDVRVGFNVEIERAGTLEIIIREHGQNHRLVLGKNKSVCVCERNGKETEFPLDQKLTDGDSLEVSFTNVDDTLIVNIDGDEFVFPYPSPPAEPPRLDDFGNRIAIRGTGLRAIVKDIFIDRDVMYQSGTNGRTEWDIPADHFMAFGDNTSSSKDSREWRVVRVELNSGEVIQWEAFDQRRGVNNPPSMEPTLADPDTVHYVQADIFGHVRRFKSGDVKTWDTIDRSFVPRRNLIGRAFSVFWPIHAPPVYKGPTRVKLIR